MDTRSLEVCRDMNKDESLHPDSKFQVTWLLYTHV